MKYFIVLFLLSLGFSACDSEKTSPELVRENYIENLDSLENATDELLIAVTNKEPNAIGNQFNIARFYYKKIEFLSEFYFPETCKMLNGPALNRVDIEDDKVIEPTGFQVIEELTFPELDSSNYSTLVDECNSLKAGVNRLKELIKTTTFSDTNIFEAARVQLLRISSLGVSGFDSPVNQNSVEEANASILGIEEFLLCYKVESKNEIFERELKTQFSKCKKMLLENTDFNSFDRALFLKKGINPLAATMYSFQQALSIANPVYDGAIQMEKDNFFQENSFNKKFFVAVETNEETTNLGSILFFDPILSGNLSRSCASCHKPGNGFADNASKNIAFNNNGVVKRNTPTLINSVYQQAQFWDGRVAFVKDQVRDVVTNKTEMHGNFSVIAKLLNESEEYEQMFRKAFPTQDHPLTESNIQQALAAYVQSLTALNSPFDKFMRGDANAMSTQQIDGFNLFMGKGKCGTCHFMPLFNGSVPPFYKETESEVLGVPSEAVIKNASLDMDEGKFALFPNPLLKHMFKTPTVRNAAITAPYMHNGVYATLEEVMDFYNRGGGSGLGILFENQTLPSEELNLSTEEQQNIIAFIHALTDTTGLTSTVKSLPKFKNKIIDSRKPGGLY
jgi:cytochrome c peroxidase